MAISCQSGCEAEERSETFQECGSIKIPSQPVRGSGSNFNWNLNPATDNLYFPHKIKDYRHDAQIYNRQSLDLTHLRPLKPNYHRKWLIVLVLSLVQPSVQVWDLGASYVLPLSNISASSGHHHHTLYVPIHRRGHHRHHEPVRMM